MTIAEFYENIQGDYKDAISRFGSDGIIKIFLQKFKAEPSFSALMTAIDSGDRKAVFSTAHALKGVAGNMAFTSLFRLSCELTEQMRPLDRDPDGALVQKVKAAYEKIILELQNLG